MATASSHCPGCFQAKQGSVKCPRCGYDESAERGASLLPYWTRLRGGRYVLGRELGAGGFAITYLAWDQSLNRLVAVKELFPQGAAARGADRVSVVSGSSGRQGAELFRYALSRFLDEARVVAGFNHPNIVKALDFFEENGTGYLVMDYYPGHTLEDKLRRTRTMPEAEALALMRPVLEGLSVVHGQRWLHRDIKPANIYLVDGARPVLLDFGAARADLGEASRSLSSILTPGYAPPEQYTSRGSKQGPWTDIYACSAVLYRMLSGVTPPAAFDRQMGEERLRPLAELRRDIRPQTAAAVERGMSLEIGRRPRSVGEFLGLFPVEEPETLGKGGITGPHPPPPPKPSGNALLIGCVIAAAAFLVIGLVVAAIAVPQFAAYKMRAWNSSAQSDLRNARTAQEVLMTDHFVYGVTRSGRLPGSGGGRGEMLTGPMSAATETFSGAMLSADDHDGDEVGVGIGVGAGVSLIARAVNLVNRDGETTDAGYIMYAKHRDGTRVFLTHSQETPLYFCENRRWKGRSGIPTEAMTPYNETKEADPEGVECGGDPVSSWRPLY